MNDTTRARLHDLSLFARRLLTDETRNLLGAVYGLSQDGRLESLSRLPAVQSSPEVAATRKLLERYLRDEAAAGRSEPEAVERLVRETAFTHLNRLVAFKLLEVRKIIRGTIDKHHASNGFLFYLADHPEDEVRYQAGDLPQDALGEGPRDVAYRHFLLWQADQLAREVRVLFDSANLASRLFPNPRTLRTLLDALNTTELREAWAIGNEETIGWVYQYFNSEELQQAFRDVRLAGKKFEKEDIPAVTQLFTPRWIVRFLVENTLGRYWLQMHPDSRLGTELEYLVPLAGNTSPAPPKLIREITLLDPACGTMHFGLVAYDLFAIMYNEELERAGEPGWPEQPSVTGTDEIPAAILTNNLFGIDIDLRAVQLAALSLYVRAKASSPKTTVTPRNLVCADVTVLNGNRLGAFVDTLGHKKPMVEAAIRALWPRLKQAGETGSLLRLETDLRAQLVGSQRGKRESGMALLPGLDNVDPGSFTTFTDLDTQVRDALNTFARQEVERGGDATTFVAGAEQGLKLLDLLARRYDVVVANPPYMSNRKMNARLKAFVADAYPAAKLDLYAAFIQRCLELCASGGRVGMLSMHSFMFISSYESLRQDVRQHAIIEAMLHLGPALFSVGNPGTLQTAAYVLHKEANSTKRDASIGTYFRLVRDFSGDAKRVSFERSNAELIHGTESQNIQNVYRYQQGDFDAIPGGPWVYWVTKGLQNLFVNLPNLSDVAQPKSGLTTADNFRFTRYWWESGFRQIARGCKNAIEAEKSSKKWFPYMKGGAFRRWDGNQELIVNWYKDGSEIKEFVVTTAGTTHWTRKVCNASYYFRSGVTWSEITPGRFGARISPGGFIFDIKGSSAFSNNPSFTLGILNSSFTYYALNLLNPTVSFQVGDLARLPIPMHTSTTLNTLVERAIALAKEDSVESDTTYDFVAPPAWPNGGRAVAARHAELAGVEREIDEEVYRLYGIEGEDRAAIEAELSGTSSQLLIESEGEEGISEAANEGAEIPEGAQLTRGNLARRWLSYALGVVLGRFQPGVEGAIGSGRFTSEVAHQLRAMADDDGIGLIAPGHPDDLGTRITYPLEFMVGEDEAHELISTATGGKSLAEYLTRDFYREHVRQYRKRPVYWLLQSPQRAYSLLVFHERLNVDSLPLLLGNRYVGGKINELRAKLGELEGHIHLMSPGRDRTRLARDRDAVADSLADVEEFAALIRAVLNMRNDQGDVVGWQPQIDDGVLINLAPLHTLIPAWSAEPKKCWQQLDRGDYDWSYTAMRYWPTRVLEKCKTNKSYAIAHGVAVE